MNNVQHQKSNKIKQTWKSFLLDGCGVDFESSWQRHENLLHSAHSLSFDWQNFSTASFEAAAFSFRFYSLKASIDLWKLAFFDGTMAHLWGCKFFMRFECLSIQLVRCTNLYWLKSIGNTAHFIRVKSSKGIMVVPSCERSKVAAVNAKKMSVQSSGFFFENRFAT